MTSNSTNWMRTAAEEAFERIGVDLRVNFGVKGWAEFSKRFDAHGERLFAYLHQLYGWRYDFAWIFEDMVRVTATGYLERSKELRRIDRDEPPAPRWMSDPKSLWAMAYLDQYANNLKGLHDRYEHLKALGVTHLHLMPLYETLSGLNDYGYAVSDYRQVRSDLGSIEQLRQSVSELRAEGISVVLDFVCGHTSEDHAWARAAATSDPYYRDFYFIFPDRTGPDGYARHLRADAALDRAGDAFTWHPKAGGGSWVWTNVHPFEWDLNYSNPRVMAAMAGELLFIANLGVSSIQMNATSSLWKVEGTSCENLPETNVVLQVMRAMTDIAAPSVAFLAEERTRQPGAIVHINPDGCRVGYNTLLRSSIWEALATVDTRLLSVTLSRHSRLPDGCVWLSFLRSYEPLRWTFADEDARSIAVDPAAHRQYLSAFYEGTWPGSFARGELLGRNRDDGHVPISGTVASLAGLEKAIADMDAPAVDLAVKRILAAYAVMLGAEGIPLLVLGDELGQLSNLSYLSEPQMANNRTNQRHDFEPAQFKPGQFDSGQFDLGQFDLGQFDLGRFETARAGEGPEGMIWAGLLRMIELRRRLVDSAPQIDELPPRPIDLGDFGVIAFQRGKLVVVVNLTSRSPFVIRENLPPGELFDQIRLEEWDGRRLAPYEYRFVTV